MARLLLLALLVPAALCATPAAADEVFAGVYAHGVDTPLTFYTGEGGADVEIGYRFDRLQPLGFLGKPAPYLIASVNTAGGTDFAGAGLGWKVRLGPLYLRPAVGLVVHDGPKLRGGPYGLRTDLGSRVLFEPEIHIGTRLSRRLAVEAGWTHISNARLFNHEQNPGIDMFGARLVVGLH